MSHIAVTDRETNHRMLVFAEHLVVVADETGVALIFTYPNGSGEPLYVVESFEYFEERLVF